MTEDSRKDALVLAMLPHAAFDGWSPAAMAAAAADLGLDPTLPARLFPGGAADAVAHWAALADARMATSVVAAGVSGSLGERVSAAVRLRLEPWAEHREAIRRAASLLALPRHLGMAARLAWNTTDAIWKAVGDQSHDFSWYTRRAILAAITSATLLYWLEDDSEGAVASWSFLRRRLNDLRRIPKLKERARSAMGGFKTGPRRRGVCVR